MDRAALRAPAHGVAESQLWLRGLRMHAVAGARRPGPSCRLLWPASWVLLSGEAGPLTEGATGGEEAAKYFRQVGFWSISSVILRRAQLAGDCEVNSVLFPSYCRSCPGFELA